MEIKINSQNLLDFSLVSIIILTCNGLSFTKKCISSIYRYTEKNYELILIDNGSTDGTIPFLSSLPNTTLIVNENNKGFSGGCNQGLSAAKGEIIVLLNNDTVVTKGWLKRLKWWLDYDNSIGIVGPRSNFILPHQAISNVPYKTMHQMHLFADEWTKKHNQDGFLVDHLSGVCMAFRRNLIDIIGGFDGRFFPGYYEDTDFSIRTRICGKKLWVANDVFIHHYGSCSFKLNNQMHREVLDRSKQKFFEKWKIDSLKELKVIVQQEKPFTRERHYIPYS